MENKLNWLPEEILKLKEIYTNNLTKDLLIFFPNRTVRSIEHMASRLGLKKSQSIKISALNKLHIGARKPRTWSEQEKQDLIKIYPQSTKKELKNHFKNHNIGSIYTMANNLNLHKDKEVIKKQASLSSNAKKFWEYSHKDDKWNKNDINKLKELYPSNSLDFLIKTLERSERSISGMAHKLNLKKNIDIKRALMKNAQRDWLNSIGWSPEELKVITTLYWRGDKNDILLKLSNRTWSGIMHKAHKLEMHRDSSFIIKQCILNGKYNPASWTQKKPTKPEQRITDVINNYNFPYKYVGNGEIIINGLNPDFINCNGQKKLIEVFGRAFHDPEKAFIPLKNCKKEYERKKIFSELGYDCLIIWDDEINKLSDDEIAKQINIFNEGK